MSQSPAQEPVPSEDKKDDRFDERRQALQTAFQSNDFVTAAQLMSQCLPDGMISVLRKALPEILAQTDDFYGSILGVLSVLFPENKPEQASSSSSSSSQDQSQTSAPNEPLHPSKESFSKRQAVASTLLQAVLPHQHQQIDDKAKDAGQAPGDNESKEQPHQPHRYHGEPSQQQHDQAQAIADRVSGRLCAWLIRCFGLQWGQERLINFANNLLRQNQVADAFIFMSELHLKAVMPIRDVLSALIKAKQFDLAVKYIGDNKEWAAMLIQMLAKVNTNFAFKVMNRFALDRRDFPEVELEAKKKSLKWIMHTNKTHEFADMLVADSPPLQHFVVSYLLSLDVASFAYFAAKYGLQDDPAFAPSFNRYWSNPQAYPSRLEIEYKQKAAANYLPLMTANPPIMVDSPQTLHFARGELLSPHTDIIGVDAEFLPDFVSAANTPALLQVSTRYTAFLFDLLCYNDEMDEVLRRVFTNKHVIKIGYGVNMDFKWLHSAMRGSRAFDEVHSILDLADVDHWMRNNKADVPELFKGSWVPSAPGSRALWLPNGAKEGSGLGKMAHVVLGRPLDKDQQMSLWTRRPLNMQQAIYAALDAFVCIQIYDGLNLVMAPSSAPASASVSAPPAPVSAASSSAASPAAVLRTRSLSSFLHSAVRFHNNANQLANGEAKEAKDGGDGDGGDGGDVDGLADEIDGMVTLSTLAQERKSKKKQAQRQKFTESQYSQQKQHHQEQHGAGAQ